MANNKSKRKNNKTKGGNHDALGMTLVVISAFLLLCIVIKPILGVFSEAIFSVILGVFGIVAYPCLVATLVLGILILMHRYGRNSDTPLRVRVCIPLLAVFLLIILQLASTHHFLNDSFSGYIGNVYSAKYSVGGVIVGTIAFGLKAIITEIACYVIFSIAVIVTVLVMTSAIPKLREKLKNRKIPKAPQEPVVPTHSMLSDEEAQRVIYTGPRGGLFIDRIEPATHHEYITETGLATEAPVSEQRNVSDYAPDHVMDGGRNNTAAVDENRQMARYRLYGDPHHPDRNMQAPVVETKRETPSDYTYTRQPQHPTYVAPQPQVAEPYERVNSDAASSDKPARSDFDGNTVGSLAEIFFPSQKNIEFNDSGVIENADEINGRMRRQAEFERATAPVFDTHKSDAPHAYVEPIINASAPSAAIDVKLSAPAPAVQSPIIGDVAPVEDRFMSALAEERTSIPPLETERFKQDDIIIGEEWKDRFVSPQDDEPIVDDSDREDIMIASNPVDDFGFGDVVQAPVGRNAIINTDNVNVYADPVVDDFDITGGDDDIISGEEPIQSVSAPTLSIIDGPAIDLSETHDNVSDLITGDDTSGMYVSADAPDTKPRKQTKSKGSSGIINDDRGTQMSITDIVKNGSDSPAFDGGKRYKKYSDYVAPPLELLNEYEKHEQSHDDLEMRKRALEDVIADVIVPGNKSNMKEQIREQVKVLTVVPGPQVTRYEVEVPSGVNVSVIESRAATIAYELAADGGIRVQAPIPGKRAIGIEVPNASQFISTIGLKEVVKSPTFVNDKSPYTFAVGKDIGGAVITCDLEKAPHFLIAGQTGSGKSVCLHSLIISLLYKASPEDIRFIFIDPKRVEFPRYRGMPHMLFENVITDVRNAIKSLKWATDEMNRRYAVLSAHSCSKISEYNNLPEVKAGKLNKLPHIVIVIDELASLMQSSKGAGNEIEGLISSFVALARAAGMHLIVATQRPSIDVITGTIKANLGSRIALRVADANNSRIIIDENGAEALAGNGDMLFFPVNYLASKRVQGTYVSGEEIAKVVNYIKSCYECDFDEEAEQFVCSSDNGGSGMGGGASGGGEGPGGMDSLTSRVMELGIRTKQLSVSVVQRRFSIGYARAARIIDSLEEKGYIGPSTGNSKPRDVLMTREIFREVFGHDPDEN